MASIVSLNASAPYRTFEPRPSHVIQKIAVAAMMAISGCAIFAALALLPEEALAAALFGGVVLAFGTVASLGRWPSSYGYVYSPRPFYTRVFEPFPRIVRPLIHRPVVIAPAPDWGRARVPVGERYASRPYFSPPPPRFSGGYGGTRVRVGGRW